MKGKKRAKANTGRTKRPYEEDAKNWIKKYSPVEETKMKAMAAGTYDISFKNIEKKPWDIDFEALRAKVHGFDLQYVTLKDCPEYIWVGGSSLRRAANITVENECRVKYFKDAGLWDVDVIVKDKKLVTKSSMKSLDGIEIRECSEIEYNESNKGYMKGDVKPKHYHNIKKNERGRKKRKPNRKAIKRRPSTNAGRRKA